MQFFEFYCMVFGMWMSDGVAYYNSQQITGNPLPVPTEQLYGV